MVKRLPHLQILDGHPIQDLHKNKGSRKSKRVYGSADRKPGKDLGTAEGSEEESEQKKSITKVTQKSESGEDTKDRPFVDLISAPEANGVKGVGKKGGDGQPKKRKDDSGVVSVLDGVKRKAFGRKSSKVAEILTEELKIGGGGPSTWDDPGLSSQSSAQGISDDVGSKPYSRWALKKK